MLLLLPPDSPTRGTCPPTVTVRVRESAPIFISRQFTYYLVIIIIIIIILQGALVAVW